MSLRLKVVGSNPARETLFSSIVPVSQHIIRTLQSYEVYECLGLKVARSNAASDSLETD